MHIIERILDSPPQCLHNRESVWFHLGFAFFIRCSYSDLLHFFKGKRLRLWRRGTTTYFIPLGYVLLIVQIPMKCMWM